MKWISLLLFLLILSPAGHAQNYQLAEQLYEEYDSFKEEQIRERRFTRNDIGPLIEELKEQSPFEVSTVGHSIEGRPINLIKLGTGDTKVLFWSQMHGDESTATMALFDLFNFFSAGSDGFSDIRRQLLEEVSLYFIPMLNPDGAQHFQRRNAIDIDVNRDALRLTSPESVVLKGVRDSLNPSFGFNLHDQSTYYSAGRSPEPATLSFLAPAYDFEQSENEVRSNAMRLIAHLNEMLQQFIPGKVAKYSDAHEPRAFGDMIQKWGTSTILIESGGYPDDPEKQYIRKLNFVSLLTAIKAIAHHSYMDHTREEYYDIPQNRSSLMDLLVREINLVRDEGQFLIDVGIRQSRRVTDSGSYYRSYISDVGDLSTSHGYDELEGQRLEAHPGQIYPDTLTSLTEVRELDFPQLLKEGYTGVVVEETPEESYLSDIPLNVIAREDHTNRIGLGSSPNMVLKEQGEVQYVIVNGYVYNPSQDDPAAISNTLVIK